MHARASARAKEQVGGEVGARRGWREGEGATRVLAQEMHVGTGEPDGLDRGVLGRGEVRVEGRSPDQPQTRAVQETVAGDLGRDIVECCRRVVSLRLEGQRGEGLHHEPGREG